MWVEPGRGRALGIDVSPDARADVVWDINTVPWPLDQGTFRRIHLRHILEHAVDVVAVMREVHRVAVADGDIFIRTPHFSSHNSYIDPTHRHHFAAATFEYFTDKEFTNFVGPRCGFQIVKIEIMFGGNLVLDNLARLVAKCSMRWYERRAAWVLPALDIHAHLRVIK